MTLTAPPPVEDPVRRDIDDAVIKEAKRRARRRRQFYGGVLAVLLATLAAFVAWDAAPPVQGPPPGGASGGGAGALAAGGAGRDADDPTAVRKGFVGLPPEGAVPSSPATGVLEFQVMTRNKRVWVYSDGRMISYRVGAPTMPEAANPTFSGFLEQHLSPEGVSRLRSYLVSGMTASSPANELEAEALTLVRVGNEAVSASVRGCGWLVGCPRITEPETWLPASAWTDQQYRAYVPSEFEICYGSWGGQAVRAEHARAALPAEVSALLWPVTSWHGNPGTPYVECGIVSTADARAIDQAFQDAGFQRPQDRELSGLSYVFDVPPVAGQTAVNKAGVDFGPVLPHGFVACVGCA